MAKTTNINTLRHARTEFNDEKRYAGSMDIPLSEKGVLEAQQASTCLRHLKYDVVITSTLKRSYETAMILVGESVPIVRCHLCNERNFGIMEGLTWDDVQRLEPPVLMIKVGEDLHTVNPKGGEPLEEVWQRAKRFCNFLLREYSGKNILIVSHGVFLQMFHGVVSGLTCIESLAKYPANMEIWQFQLSGRRLAGKSVLNLADHANGTW